MARLADIAKHADVSEATVSRVLNGDPGVAEATRQAVLTSLDVLGYDRPSRLRRKSAGLVGLLIPELTNPIFPAFAQVIETALVRHGFTPVLCTQTPGGVHEDDYVQMLLDRGVAGIIYVSGQHADTTTDPRRYVHLRDRGLPIVLVNGFMRRASTRRSSPTTTRRRWSCRSSHLVHSGTADRPGRRVRPLRPGACARSAGFRRLMSTLLGQRGRRGHHRDRALHRRGWAGRRVAADRARVHRARLRVRPDGPRRGPGRAGAGYAGVPRTSRSSATTTRPSSPSPTRR